MSSIDDDKWMSLALEQAKIAQKNNEVPVGCILVKNRQLLAYGHNQTLKNNDPTAHAEIIAIRQATKLIKNYRLIDTELFVTLEPCAMCTGAIIHARVKRVVIATLDKKTGCMVSKFQLCDYFNHKPTIYTGCRQQEASDLMVNFFKAKR